jgi:pilus assembly protein CpaE
MTSTIIIAGSNADVDHLFQSAGFATRIAPELFENGRTATPHPPNVLVIDLRGRSRLPAWVADWKRRHPGTPVVLLATAPDPALMLAAMRSGINECLVEPLTRADAEAAIARVTSAGMSGAGHVFAFVGAKGGVGTTTVALNVAVALWRAAGSTLFVDLNTAGGDAALMLGAEPRFSVLDALANTHRADETFFRGLLTDTRSGLPLLAAPSAPFVALVDPGRLRALLDFARHRYRHVVLDVPRGGPAAREALEAAGAVVIVANQELATLRTAALLAAAMRSADTVESIGVLLNGYDERATLDQKEIEETVGLPVMARLPRDYRAAVDAANRGEPIVGSRTELGRSLEQFARRLARLSDEDRSRHGGMFARLGGTIAAAFSGAAS